jgi:cytidine deaminase
MFKKDLSSTKVEVSNYNSSLIRPKRLEDGDKFKYLKGVVTSESILYPLTRARAVRRHADSHRNFSVGAAGQIFRRGGMIRFLEHGVNIKNEPGVASRDIHAEDFIMQTLKLGDKLASLAIVAPTQNDSESDIKAPTLHPCFKCRHKISDAGDSTKDSLIVCATPDIQNVQWGDISDYQNFHAGKPHNLATATFNDTPELFRPIPLKSGEPIDLRDPNMDVDTEEWDAKVTYPMIEWILARLT